MLFDTLFEFLVYYLGFLLVVGLLGAVFSRKYREFGGLSKVSTSNLTAGRGSAGIAAAENLAKRGGAARNLAKNSQNAALADFKDNGVESVSANFSPKKSPFKGLYKHCPCRKAVDNGLMSSVCIYSSTAGFMLSLTNIALIGNYAWQNFAVLGLSLLCAWLGWVLKK